MRHLIEITREKDLYRASIGWVTSLEPLEVQPLWSSCQGIPKDVMFESLLALNFRERDIRDAFAQADGLRVDSSEAKSLHEMQLRILRGNPKR